MTKAAPQLPENQGNKPTTSSKLQTWLLLSRVNGVMPGELRVVVRFEITHLHS
jgi:hypothetical protein